LVATDEFLFSRPHRAKMALLQYPAPVDYAAQQEAFKDFLKNFKTSESASEAAATEAIQGLRIDGDRTDDEYDFMDDVDTEQRRDPKTKYMQVLQDIANRDSNNILIELDDLETVSQAIWPQCFLFSSLHAFGMILSDLNKTLRSLRNPFLQIQTSSWLSPFKPTPNATSMSFRKQWML
jgi:MCM N-terminal domain